MTISHHITHLSLHPSYSSVIKCDIAPLSKAVSKIVCRLRLQGGWGYQIDTRLGLFSTFICTPRIVQSRSGVFLITVTLTLYYLPPMTCHNKSVQSHLLSPINYYYYRPIHVFLLLIISQLLSIRHHNIIYTRSQPASGYHLTVPVIAATVSGSPSTTSHEH